MKSSYLAAALMFLTVSLPVGALEEGVDPAIDKQLTATERQEYRARMDQAGDDAQRKQITEQYRKTVESRTKSAGANKNAQQKKQKAGGPGHGNPAASRPGPSGSKNKPQKSGH